jgi:hypothetical protein
VRHLPGDGEEGEGARIKAPLAKRPRIDTEGTGGRRTRRLRRRSNRKRAFTRRH